MLIRLLCLVSYQFLRELLHEISCHSNDFRIIEVFFHMTEVFSNIVFEVSISHIVILILQLNVEGGKMRIWFPLSVLLLCELVALLDFSLFEEYPTHHCIFIQKGLDIL